VREEEEEEVVREEEEEEVVREEEEEGVVREEEGQVLVGGTGDIIDMDEEEVIPEVVENMGAIEKGGGEMKVILLLVVEFIVT
jgi:hypothetical protein